jgi:nitrogen regulatory protein PII
MVVLPDLKKNDAVNIIKENSKIGKIFIAPVIDAIDLATGVEGENAI